MPDMHIQESTTDAALAGAAAHESVLDEEVYAALRAAGASPEEAFSCLADTSVE